LILVLLSFVGILLEGEISMGVALYFWQARDWPPLFLWVVAIHAGFLADLASWTLGESWLLHRLPPKLYERFKENRQGKRTTSFWLWLLLLKFQMGLRTVSFSFMGSIWRNLKGTKAALPPWILLWALNVLWASLIMWIWITFLPLLTSLWHSLSLG
jgi:hypothetical protein